MSDFSKYKTNWGARHVHESGNVSVEEHKDSRNGQPFSVWVGRVEHRFKSIREARSFARVLARNTRT